MMFRKESSQAIFEMGNVELIEFKTSRNAHHVYTMFSKEPLFAHVASMSDPTKKWYDVSKQLLKFSKHPTSVRLWFLQGITNKALTCGRNTTTKQKTHYKVWKRGKEILRRSGIYGKMTRPTGTLNAPLVGQMLGWDNLDHIAQIGFSHRSAARTKK